MKTKWQTFFPFVFYLSVPVNLFSGVSFCSECKEQIPKSYQKIFPLFVWLYDSVKWLKLDFSLGSTFGFFKDLCQSWASPPSPKNIYMAWEPYIYIYLRALSSTEWRIEPCLQVVSKEVCTPAQDFRPKTTCFAFSHDSCLAFITNSESRTTHQSWDLPQRNHSSPLNFLIKLDDPTLNSCMISYLGII